MYLVLETTGPDILETTELSNNNSNSKSREWRYIKAIKQQIKRPIECFAKRLDYCVQVMVQNLVSIYCTFCNNDIFATELGVLVHYY